jgi:hypothetical protein
VPERGAWRLVPGRPTAYDRHVPESEASMAPQTAAVEVAEPPAVSEPLAIAGGPVAVRASTIAGIRRLGGSPVMRAPLARAAVRGLGNRATVRLLARRFVKQPPTAEEKAAGEAAVRADKAKHQPLVSAARAKYDAQASKLVGGMKADWAKEKLDKIPEEVPASDAPKFATITEDDVRAAFQSAWSSIFSQPIPGHALGTLVGQWKAEGGKTGIADFNLGNVTYKTEKGKAVDAESDYRKRTAGEAQGSGAKVPKTAFYAVYTSLEQGAAGLLRRLIAGANGGPALLAALVYGTREEYVYVLKSYNYFTGPIRNIMITDREGQQVIWWSGYLDSMSSVPEVNVPPTPPPQPAGTDPPPGADAGGDGGSETAPPPQGSGPAETAPPSTSTPEATPTP